MRIYLTVVLNRFFLDSRKAVGKPFGIKFTSNTFSSDYSNVVADKAGYHLELEYPFDEILRMYPVFPSIKSSKLAMKTLKFD